MIHAVILLTTSGLSVMVTAVLGPSLPKMQTQFASIANADYWVPLTLTVPMLVMAALSIFAGALSDRVGRKKLLVASTAAYAICGTAPLYLDSLSAIFISRIGLGSMEAVLMTISTTMIGDYYDDARRQKYMALQTTTAAVLAFTFNVLGGFLGEFGWRTPYVVYLIGAPLALLMAIYLWEPKNFCPLGQPHSGGNWTLPPDTLDCTEPAFRPLLLLGICALATLGGIAFMIVPVHLGMLFAAIGVRSSAQIGLSYAFNSLGVVGGTLAFGWLIAPRLRVSHQVALCFAVTALGCVLLGVSTSYVQLTLAAIVKGFGAGLMLPTLVTWTMRELPFEKRGLGTGAFQSAFFLGMFLNPLVVVRLANILNNRATAVGVMGAAMLFIAAMSWFIAMARPPALQS